MRKTCGLLGSVALMALAISNSALAQDDERALVLEIYKELIEIKTTHSEQNNTRAAESVAARFREAGFPEHDIFQGGALPHKGNVVVRLRGSGEKEPLILLAHLDVVEAEREDWNMDPFTLFEKDGYFYGRGTLDDKAMAAIFAANLIRYKREGFVPDRDLVVALTSDEEGGGSNGVIWLLRNHRELIDGAFALNEGGYGLLEDGKPVANTVQTAEKVFASFLVTAKNPGGHSSIPRPDNAIFALAEALIKIRDYAFPVVLNEVMRLGLERLAEITPGQRGDDMRAILEEPPDPRAMTRLLAEPLMNAQLRTTAVPTMLEGGHASNALPQMAKAVVNSRMMPGSDPEEVLGALIAAVDDPEIEVVYQGGGAPSEPSPLTDEILDAIESTTEEMWPGVIVLPTMSTGATDGAKMRNAGIPTYGVSGIFVDRNDIRAHGQDERLAVESFYQGHEFLYRLVKKLSS